MRKNSELLAPAGSIQSLNAAVRGGADAVYLGLSEFNARRNADNFNLDNLAEAVDYCHLHSVKVYVAMNTIVITNEVKEWIKYAQTCYDAGVDALIIQDFGLAKAVSECFEPEFVHLSTQMNIHNKDGIDFVHMLGAGRVTLARELSLSEIAEICKYAHERNIEVETFVHGAICVCYSGQCLFSSLVGGRSANRGTCAQACRLPYTLICNGSEVKTASKLGNYLLSPKDMCVIDKIPELIQAGVDSFKIEGRMKSPEYVYSAVKAYAEKCASPEIETSNSAKLSLESTFSRGFTFEYLEGKCDNEMMSFSRPNNRGVFVGRVEGVKILEGARSQKNSKNRSGLIFDKASTKINFSSQIDLMAGDILEIWTHRGRTTFTMPETFDSQGAGSYKITLNEELKGVNKSDRIFRVRSASDAFTFDITEPKIDVDVVIDMHIGSPIQVEVSARGCSVSIEGDKLEVARTKPITSDDVFEHFNRLGNSPFSIASFDCNLDEGAGLGFSVIHKLRAEALDKLSAEIIHKNKRNHLSNVSLADKCKTIVNTSSKKIKNHPAPTFEKKPAPEICVLATNPGIARLARRKGISKIYVPEKNFKRGNATLAGTTLNAIPQAGYPKDVIIMKPLVNRKNSNSDGAEGMQNTPLYVEDYGSLYRAIDSGDCFEIGQMLPVTNSIAASVASAFSPNTIWLSPELNLAQIKDVAKNIDCEVGIFAFGWQKIMTCEHCALMAFGKCDQNCKSCSRRKQACSLRDEKGYEFPIMTNAEGRTSIYNSVELDVFSDVAELRSACVTKYMIDTTFMTEAEASDGISYALNSLKNPPQNRQKNHTSGHLHRGVK